MSYRGQLSPLRNPPAFPFAVYDIETVSIEDMSFNHIGFFDGQEYRNFRDLSAFFAHVLQDCYSGWRIFGHNAGRFDVNFLFDYLYGKRPDITYSFYCSGSAVIRFTVFDGTQEWAFCDSLRLLPRKLADLGKAFKTAHQKLEFDANSIEYNEHDCRCLYEVLEAFFGRYSICAETIASYAMNVFRLKYLERDLPVMSREVEEFVRRSYFGGRVEIFRWDEAELFDYDFNSLYPSAMLEPVPVEYIGASRNLPSGSNEMGFYEAVLTMPEIYIPSLPVLHGKLYFPVGRLRGCWTSLELEQAISDGAKIEKITAGHLFRTEPVFRSYALDLYRQKAAAEAAKDEATREITKLLLNSLYGKTGQRRWRQVYITDGGQALAPDGSSFAPLQSGLASYWEECKAAYILPHLASTITSRARLSILKQLREAIPIWYTDTDSLFSSREIPTGKNLGEMKLIGHDRFKPYGIKEYQFGAEQKAKGVPKDFRTAYFNDEEIFSMRISSIKESIRIGLPAARKVEVSRKRRYPPEKRARIGNDTRPLDYEREILNALKQPRMNYRISGESLVMAIQRAGGIRRKSLRWKVFDHVLGREVYRTAGEWADVPEWVMKRITTNDPNALGIEEILPALHERGFWQYTELSEVINALSSAEGRTGLSLEAISEQTDLWPEEEFYPAE